MGADILVAPLSVVARGHNILQPGTAKSAIGSIFVLVRPVPPAESATRALAYVSYEATHAPVQNHVGSAITALRQRAERHLRYVQSRTGPFSSLPPDLRHHIVCDVLNDLEQLTGRARRGGTDVRVYLVDAAFHEGAITWKLLLKYTFARWREDGALEEMLTLHRSFLSALRRFAGELD